MHFRGLRERVNVALLTMVVVTVLTACSGASPAASPVTSPETTPVTQPTPTNTETTPVDAEDPVALPGAPRTFVAQVGDSLVRFNSTSGAKIRSLTSPPTRSRDDAAVAMARRVVSVRHVDGSACKSSVRWVSNNGQRGGILVPSGLGSIGDVGVSPDGATLAYTFVPCRSDLPSQIRVVDVSSGDVILEIFNPRGGNGPLNPGELMFVRGRLIIFVGIHLTTWLASVDVASPEATSLPNLPTLPFPERCRLDNVEPQGARSIVGFTDCGRELRVFHIIGADLETVRLSRQLPSDLKYAYISGATDDGHLIGLARRGREDVVLQVHGRRVRDLPQCTSSDPQRERCADQPVWR